ncbi:MAG: threonine synthase [Clostridia bacterium]|nr:threonine synthase [Clostridia bacterium]
MFYKSTRDDSLKVTASQAIAQGISNEGGLFIPESFPDIKGELESLSKLNYIERAKKIFSFFLTDFTEDEIAYCVENAYRPEKFENSAPTKVVKILDGEKTIYSLELWHGPTCAFKDMALQILPYFLTTSLKKNAQGKKAVILVATSGDTGKAALEGFKDVENTEIIVFYPENGVSPMQLRQMATQEGNNVCVCAVKGNFDDCQTQVKRVFTDPEIKAQLAENNMMFSSANSINWGRLLPQVVYYISTYLDLYAEGEIENLETPVNVVVPTGNFGNILAAYYAKLMGIPFGKFICASNSNNVLTDFISGGTYNKNRPFFTTNSPSMDILVSSNLERLLYHLSGNSTESVKKWMNELNTDGSYTIDESTAEKVFELFAAGCCDDEATGKTIAEKFENLNYLLDTHTAVAFNVYDSYVENTKDVRPAIIASTASPYKFSKSVAQAIGLDTDKDEYEIIADVNAKSGLNIPESLLALKDKEVRFNNLTDRDTIKDFVLTKLGINK